MSQKRELLIERVQNQTRLAVLEEGRLCELYCERGRRTKLAGNIYAGRVQNVLPGMNAAFVDIGLKKNGFLYAGDIGWDTRDQEQLAQQLEGARIERMLSPGQMIVVQVIKEPGGSKGPRISGHLSLPGRLSVLLPGLRYAGVSKKIEDEGERDRLFAIADELSRSCGAGVIIRTAAEGTDERAIQEDYARLLKDWQRIEGEARHSAQPRLIQPDGDLVLRAVRDMLDEDVTLVRTDDYEVYRQLVDCARILTPQFADRISLYEGDTPIFDLMRVDHQMEEAFARQVRLRSGGTLVIDETEALTVIDVNTAKFTGKKSLGETVFRLNCEAAREIARQLRLRDIGGIIVIDFIDMPDAGQQQELMEQLRSWLRADANRTNVLGMTQLGLVEMTRKKARIPLSRQFMRPCTRCQGAGREWTSETVAYRAVRELWRRRRMGDDTPYLLRASESVAEWMQTIGLPEGGPARIECRPDVMDFQILPDDGCNDKHKEVEETL